MALFWVECPFKGGLCFYHHFPKLFLSRSWYYNTHQRFQMSPFMQRLKKANRLFHSVWDKKHNRTGPECFWHMRCNYKETYCGSMSAHSSSSCPYSKYWCSSNIISNSTLQSPSSRVYQRKWLHKLGDRLSHVWLKSNRKVVLVGRQSKNYSNVFSKGIIYIVWCRI